MAGGSPSELWSVAFARSSLSPLIFTVRPAYRATAWRALSEIGVSLVRHTSRTHRLWSYPRESFRSVAAVAGGFVVELEWHDIWCDGRLPSGMWVVGVRPLRLLIELLGLRAPTRPLNGVPEWGSDADLVAEARAEVAALGEAQEAQTQPADAITYPNDLKALAWGLYGESSLVEGGWLPDAPGRGRWGTLGFNRRVERVCQSVGITPDEAALWRDEVGVKEGGGGLRWDSVVRLSGPLEKSLRDAIALRKEGCPPQHLAAFLKTGDGLRTYRQFMKAGFDPEDASRYAYAGVDADEAVEWRSLGLCGDDAFRFVKHRRSTLETIRRIIESGTPAHDVAAAWRRIDLT